MKFLINWISTLLILGGIIMAASYPQYEAMRFENDLKRLCVEQKGRIVYTGPSLDKFTCQYGESTKETQ